MKLKQELSSALNKLHYREVEIVKLKSEIITKERQIEKSISALGTCRTQAAIIQEKCGLDKPSCLFSNKGKTAYLANITLKNSSFHIKSINEKETSRLFGSSSNKLNSKKFKKMARIAFNDSKKQPLECRYFVKVIDRTTNKDSYKAQLSTVQEFFYTRLEK
jgi:hypothetical protein